MKNIDIRTWITRILTLIVILVCAFLLYNTNIKSKQEQLAEIKQFESNLEVKKNTDKSTVDLAELELNMVGVLYVPSIDLTIPIYDETSEDALRKGVGIIEGTGTLTPQPHQNTILTSHNGDNMKDLFINLQKVKENDEFYIKDQENNITKFQVKNIQVVEPVDEDRHWIKDNTPKVTLRTCTPTGINSHRLLVTGDQVEYDGNGIPKGKLTLSMYEIQLIILLLIAIIIFLFTFRRTNNEEEDEYDEYFDWYE